MTNERLTGQAAVVGQIRWTNLKGSAHSLKAVELANLTSPTLAQVVDQATGAPGLLVPAPRRPVGLMTPQPNTQDP